MLGVGAVLFVSGIMTHCMCQQTDRAAEISNDIVPIEPVSSADVESKLDFRIVIYTLSKSLTNRCL